MSFSYDVKNEIAAIEPKKECCESTLNNCFDIAALQRSIKGKCCVKTFLRQAFIKYGSVNNPENSYHLEMVIDSENLSSYINVFLNDFKISSKILLRNGDYIVYVKNAESVADFLKLAGASSSLMEFENVRIVKDMKRNINRSINCDSANIQKKIDAAFRQAESINYIRDTVGIEYLPEELCELAVLRLENMNMGLTELGDRLGNKLSKSGVNHRMKRLMDIAGNLKKEKL